MDDIIVQDIINNGSQAEGEATAGIRIAEHLAEELEIRLGIGELKL